MHHVYCMGYKSLLLLAEMYGSIGIHELPRKGKELHLKLPNTCMNCQKKGQGTTPEVTKYMLAEIYGIAKKLPRKGKELHLKLPNTCMNCRKGKELHLKLPNTC